MMRIVSLTHQTLLTLNSRQSKFFTRNWIKFNDNNS